MHAPYAARPTIATCSPRSASTRGRWTASRSRRANGPSTCACGSCAARAATSSTQVPSPRRRRSHGPTRRRPSTPRPRPDTLHARMARRSPCCCRRCPTATVPSTSAPATARSWASCSTPASAPSAGSSRRPSRSRSPSRGSRRSSSTACSQRTCVRPAVSASSPAFRRSSMCPTRSCSCATPSRCSSPAASSRSSATTAGRPSTGCSACARRSSMSSISSCLPDSVTRLLAAAGLVDVGRRAIRNRYPLRYGCACCRCRGAPARSPSGCSIAPGSATVR